MSKFFKTVLQTSSYIRVGVPAATAFGLGGFSWKKKKEETTKKWRTIPLEELRKHYSPDTGLWVSFRGSVYDITSFVDGHPGLKSRILMAGGTDLEPYWDVYRDHYRGHVIPFLEKFKIGEMTEEDWKEAKNFTFGNSYENDPKRHPDLLYNTVHPFNGECLLERLVENYYTPNELHYVRNHLPVPDIDENEYTLTIEEGNGVKKEKVYTLKDLKTKFKKYDVVSTLQCAGNRREDFHGSGEGENKIFIGPHWVVGAISNAKWSGCRLRDVLKDAGVEVDKMAFGELDDPNMQHIHFTGYDMDETGLEYGVSIPIDKAVDPLGDCILAYEMNEQPLPRDHGYPVRALVPGHAGARNCKWLQSVAIQPKQSRKPWQWNAYRGFAPDIKFEDDLYQWEGSDKIKLDQAPIAQEMPVTSMICYPPINSEISGKNLDEIEIKGICWSGGGRGIHRCDVSIDGGKTFTAADLWKPVKQRRMREWGWFHFSKTIKLSDEQKKSLKNGKNVSLELVSRAVNGDYNVQPEHPEPVYNARGICINHWYRVPITINPKLKENTIKRNYSKDLMSNFRNYPTGGTYLKQWGEPDYKGNEPSKWHKDRKLGKDLPFTDLFTKGDPNDLRNKNIRTNGRDYS